MAASTFSAKTPASLPIAAGLVATVGVIRTTVVVAAANSASVYRQQTVLAVYAADAMPGPTVSRNAGRRSGTCGFSIFIAAVRSLGGFAIAFVVGAESMKLRKANRCSLATRSVAPLGARATPRCPTTEMGVV